MRRATNQLRERGDQIISLGLALLANVEPENPEAILSLEKGIELIYEYERFNTVYHYKSLYHFKQKFVPRWESCYLLYPGLATLPRVVYALVNAQMPHFGPSELAKLVR